ncbi:MAG: hypothetical protein AseanaTS_17160 [Candidatus Pelagadaptatus aseana]|uniref:PA1571 family protein n=1 Tax=Candidatus Pelagadaptatus aseana TaxID=3120508 RepID=UPI0039B2484A
MLSIQAPLVATSAQQQSHFARDFHGAAIIDASGNEIPMTAEMIDSTLERLSEEWERQHHNQSRYPYNLTL